VLAAWASPLAEGAAHPACAPTPSRPKAHWDFHCNLHPGSDHVLADVSFIHPLAASYVHSTTRNPGNAAALRDADKRWDYFADHNCPGYSFHAISLKRWRSSVPVPCNASAKPPKLLSPQPGHQRAICFANVYRQLSVVQCCYLCCMLTPAAGLHNARTGSGWIRGTPRRFRTRHAVAVAGFVGVGVLILVERC
jgi:hypothetical protein